MCQASEGESNYLHAADKSMRSRGYNAFNERRARDSASWEQDFVIHKSDLQQWEYGWDTAAAGKPLW